MKTTYQKTFLAKLVFTVESDSPLDDVSTKVAVDHINKAWKAGFVRLADSESWLRLFRFEVSLFDISDFDEYIYKIRSEVISRIETKLDSIITFLKSQVR